jgi:hypothetical protein
MPAFSFPRGPTQCCDALPPLRDDELPSLPRELAPVWRSVVSSVEDCPPDASAPPWPDWPACDCWPDCADCPDRDDWPDCVDVPEACDD